VIAKVVKHMAVERNLVDEYHDRTQAGLNRGWAANADWLTALLTPNALSTYWSSDNLLLVETL
jgi:hypothetical protein